MMDPVDETLRQWGDNIRNGRIAAGYATQAALADKLGVRQSTVARWEAGLIGPRDAMKQRLAGLLGQDVRQLFPLTRVVA